MSGLVQQQIAEEKAEREAQLQRERDAHDQAVREQQSYEHENLHMTFKDKYELFAAENESRNIDAREHALGTREEIQEIVDRFRDRDRPCHICIFGLMGHGKSRTINLMLTAITKEPSAQGGAVSATRKSTSEREASETVVAVGDVPSGDGSTTRSYSRYLMPMSSSKGGGRYMLYLVDTIGVKFSDEFNPPRQEIDAEFALVRSQLRGLDFRKRVGVIAQTIPGAGPASSSVVKGEDVMTITPDVPGTINLSWLSDQLRRRSGGWMWIPGITQPLTESQVNGAGGRRGAPGTGAEGTATVTLRGGHVIRGVPWSFLSDPDGTNWTLNPDGTFKEKRTFGQRLRHAMQNWKTYQPRCQAVVLVTNPHQPVPAKVYMAWKRAFQEARMAQVPVVATHSDVLEVFGAEDAAQQASRAQQFLSTIDVNAAGADRTVHFVENYHETSDEQPRRWVSEVGALESLAAAARVAQLREQQAEDAGGISEMASTTLLVTTGALMAITMRRKMGKGISYIFSRLSRKKAKA